jgi:ABC-2 type transport system ATP-binding protein
MLIDMEHVALRLNGVPVLRDVSLTLAEGEIYGLLGPNGAGKSTTIAVALGLLPHDAGRVQVLGQDPLSHPVAVHRQVGVLPEQNGFYGWMTGADYLSFFARLYGRPDDRDSMQKLINQVGLAPRAAQRISTYSRGMKQRLGLARALVPQPRLLVLDEPTNGLDPRGRREIHDALIELSGRHGVGILLCTHLLDDVDRLCQRVGILTEGRSVVEGAITELLRHGHSAARFRLRLAGAPPEGERLPAGVSLILGEGEWWTADVEPGTAPEQAWRELLFLGWPVIEVVRLGGGLEDLYLSLTEQREVA